MGLETGLFFFSTVVLGRLEAVGNLIGGLGLGVLVIGTDKVGWLEEWLDWTFTLFFRFQSLFRAVLAIAFGSQVGSHGRFVSGSTPAHRI